MKTTLIIYHEVKPGTPCPDGIASAWVASRALRSADLLGHAYGQPLPDVLGYKKIVIVDYSFPRPVLEEWEFNGIELVIIDHHKTAMNDLAGLSCAIFDMQESGATLTWKTFFPDEPCPDWLQYVKDRDLWNFDLPYSEEIHEAVSDIGREFAQIEVLCKLSSGDLQNLFALKGARLLAPKRQKIVELAANAQVISVKGCKAIAVSIPEGESRLTSDLASFLYKTYAAADFALVATLRTVSSPNGWALSFRSDKKGNDFDVSEIAKHFDGGGHRNASGGFISQPGMSWEEVQVVLR